MTTDTSDWEGILNDCFSHIGKIPLQDIKQFIDKNFIPKSHATKVLGDLKNRFKCAACDGAKCEHTHTCQCLTDAKAALHL